MIRLLESELFLQFSEYFFSVFFRNKILKISQIERYIRDSLTVSTYSIIILSKLSDLFYLKKIS